MNFFSFHLVTGNEYPWHNILFVRSTYHSNATLINLHLYSTTVASDFIYTVLRSVGQNLCFKFRDPGFKLDQKFVYFVVIVWLSSVLPKNFWDSRPTLKQRERIHFKHVVYWIQSIRPPCEFSWR